MQRAKYMYIDLGTWANESARQHRLVRAFIAREQSKHLNENPYTILDNKPPFDDCACAIKIWRKYHFHMFWLILLYINGNHVHCIGGGIDRLNYFIFLFACLVWFFTSWSTIFSHVGTFFLGWTRTKQQIKFLAQWHNTQWLHRGGTLRSRLNFFLTLSLFFTDRQIFLKILKAPANMHLKMLIVLTNVSEEAKQYGPRLDCSYMILNS